MTIALVDDSDSDIELLHDYLSRYCHDHHVYMTIEKFTDEHIFLNSMQHKAYDLVFLDIYMEHMDGIQLACEISREDPKCQIIFITTSEEHAVAAYRVHALDYLVKPYKYVDLEDALDHYEQIASRFARYIELKEGRYRSYMSFDMFLPMLSPYANFLWCYRNCTVNMDYIESFSHKEFILKNKERIPIASARRQEVLQLYADYIFDHRSKGDLLS